MDHEEGSEEILSTYICKELEEDIVYLTSMHITQRAIIEYDVADMHLRLVNFDPMS